MHCGRAKTHGIISRPYGHVGRGGSTTLSNVCVAAGNKHISKLSPTPVPHPSEFHTFCLRCQQDWPHPNSTPGPLPHLLLALLHAEGEGDDGTCVLALPIPKGEGGMAVRNTQSLYICLYRTLCTHMYRPLALTCTARARWGPARAAATVPAPSSHGGTRHRGPRSHQCPSWSHKCGWGGGISGV